MSSGTAFRRWIPHILYNNMMAFIRNARFAFRQIWKQRTVSFLNITGLAFSIACCSIIGLYVSDQLGYDSFHPNSDRIFRITETQKQPGGIYQVAVTPGPLAAAISADFPEVQNTVRISKWSGVFKVGGRATQENEILLTDPSFFTTFHFPLLLGNPNELFKNDDEIVITENAAVKYFGANWKTRQDLIGETFTYNDEREFRLSGIVSNPPSNSSIGFAVLLPLNYLLKSDQWSNKWNSNNYHTYLELKPATDVASLERKIKWELKKHVPDTEDALNLQPLRKQYLQSDFDFDTDWGKRSDIKYVRIFSAVGLILLLIAGVNFINLSTAGSFRRSGEVAVRKVNGATRSQLVIQFLGESLLLALISGAVSIVLVVTLLPYLNEFAGINIANRPLNARLISIVAGFILVLGVLAGLYPAFVLSSFNPVKNLRTSRSLAGAKLLFRSLIVFQFVVSIALVISAVFMFRQLQFVQSRDLGFNKTDLLSVRLNGKLGNNISSLKNELERKPSISSVSPATMSLVNVNNTSNFKWTGMPTDLEFLITQANVDPDFLRTLDMSLVSGENFSTQKTNDTANFILNETAVLRMGFTPSTVIGTGIEFWGAKGKVIGVVKDFNFKPLSTVVEPFVFRYQPLDRYFTLLVKLKAGNREQGITDLTNTLRKFETELPVEYSFVDESLNKFYADDRFTANLIMLFSCLTVFIGCLGLFGLSFLVSEQRIREIGIRKVLGAGFASVATLLTSGFIRLVLIAGFISLPIAYLLVGRWLESFAYRIEIDIMTFGIVMVVVLFIACVVMLFQVKRVMQSNPTVAMRKY